MNEQQQVQIKASDERVIPNYSNHIQISHTPEEFVLELFSVYPPQGALISRVVISPAHAKRLLQALNENVGKFEQSFGEIKAAAIPFKLNV